MDFTNKVVKKYSGSDFTPSQIKGLELLDIWYHNPDKLNFTLSGKAGTGKTYILNHFIRNTVKESICVTAPTHKAVRQVELSTSKKGKTLQSLHGLRPNMNLEEFDINNVSFDALSSPTIQNYKIVIIDECSMVNKDLHNLNLRRAKDFNVKILYVGDPNQLPPINELISPTFLIEDKFELKEIVRQNKDNPLIPLMEILTNDIQYGTNNFLSYLSKNPKKWNDKGEGYSTVNDANFMQKAIEVFEGDKFSENTDYARLGAWKNNTILYRNNTIRNSLFSFFRTTATETEVSKTPIVDQNDLFIGYKTILDEYNSTTLINSEDYSVVKMADRNSQEGFKSFAVTLASRHTESQININLVDHTDKSFIVFYENVKKKYFAAKFATANRGSKWKEYYDYKDNHLCLITFPIRQGDETIAWVPKDIDYGFGLTIHKLQGSTITNMFVDLNDLLYYSNGTPVANFKNNPNAIDTRNRLIYTALSRASKFVLIHWSKK